MIMSTMHVGKSAEKVAAAFLELKGYRILESNYRYLRREIDIIAATGGRIVFVEVKCRTGVGRGTPAEAVGRVKMRHIVQAAKGYLKERGIEALPCRFDLVEIRVERGGLSLRVEHIPSAFGADERRW
jgi:putative endonuclease